MGGYNSSRWGKHSKKRSVERSYTLNINHVVKSIPLFALRERRNWTGMLTCTDERGTDGHIGCAVDWQTDVPRLVMAYRLNEQVVNLTVELETTACNYGGCRYWFTCPACKQRVGCLHLPYGARLFQCRKCHDLAYTSSQEAHYWDKTMMGTLAASIARYERFTALLEQQQKCKSRSIAWRRLEQQIERLTVESKQDQMRAALWLVNEGRRMEEYLKHGDGHPDSLYRLNPELKRRNTLL